MTEFENNCYGMSIDEIHEQYINGLTAKLSGLEMVVMGILSDVQELNDVEGYSEIRRKQLNVAKYILMEIANNKEMA